MTEQQIEEIVAAKVKIEMTKIRKRRISLFLLSVVLVPITVWATAITKPYTFTSGTSAVAAEVNANFDALFTKVNALDAKLEKGLGTYCGSTASTSGNLGGYTGAKGLCATACGNANAHMCTSNELSISRQFGITVPNALAWYSSFVRADASSNAAADCAAWTDATAGNFGAVIALSPQNPGMTNCNTSLPVLCCL